MAFDREFFLYIRARVGESVKAFTGRSYKRAMKADVIKGVRQGLLTLYLSQVDRVRINH